MLHITNGDETVKALKQAGIEGDFLPWRDLLHEGPVKDNLSLNELSKQRARFIADQHWGSPESLRESFTTRDAKLAEAALYPEVVLWFEQDLYDQLQLLQLLDYFACHGLRAPKLVQSSTYLALLDPEQLLTLFQQRQPVEQKQFKLAQRAWSAFRSNSPLQWASLRECDTRPLPYLSSCVIRLLEQYPNCRSGLNRTERQILNAVAEGNQQPGDIFSAAERSEADFFLGDMPFWHYISRLCQGPDPLLTLVTEEDAEFLEPHACASPKAFAQQTLQLTRKGGEVLRGEARWQALVSYDRWLGGVHITANNFWCWDCDHQALIRTSPEELMPA